MPLLDAAALADWLKQKCLEHLLKDLSELEASKTRGMVRSARAVTAVLRDALATCRQQAIGVLEYLIKLQQFGETPPPWHQHSRAPGR